MKKLHRRILSFLLTAVLLLGMSACGKSKIRFQIDENGYLTWEPMANAVKYECNLVDGAYICQETFFLMEPGYQLPEGHTLHVRALFDDGSASDWRVSPQYGESVYDVLAGEDGRIDPNAFPNLHYNLRWDQLQSFELLSTIRWDTVRTDAAGLLHFEADGPHGVMRFEGEGVTAENGQLTFLPKARIWALDAIGRICAMQPRLSQTGSLDNMVDFSGGYTFTQATSVDSHEELICVLGQVITTADAIAENTTPTELMDWQPNFIIFGSNAYSQDAFSLSELTVYYDTTTFTSSVRHMFLEPEFYGRYLSGETYDPGREVFDLDNHIYTFYLGVNPELKDEVVRYDPAQDSNGLSRALTALTPEQFKTGALRRSDSTPVDRSTPLEPGMTIDVTVGDYTYPVALPVFTAFRGAQNLNQLVPFAYPEASGQMNAILIPVAWQDQPENATPEKLLELKGEVGRVLEHGTETDYSHYLSESRFSLSQYFDIASYGKLRISTFVTDWFIAPFDYSTYQTVGIEDPDFRAAAYAWLMDNYDDMDWTAFDKDGNGYLDAVIFLNVGTSDLLEFYPGAFSGGAHYLPSYNGAKAGTAEKPAINGFINVNANILSGNTLIHEFGHNLGLIDYYDVTYTGIDAVGGYDMQSGSYGDWNAYSKYAVGWIQPTVVDLKPGESAEYILGAFCDTGDALLIPANRDTFDGPFNEYILVDFFTDGGVNVHDAQHFGLTDSSGVRIYHIDARMEAHVEEENGVSYSLGTPAKVNAFDPNGIYQVELIQAGGDNTFTDLDNLRAKVMPEDLFQTGDAFILEAYEEFFHNGKLDDGSQFPYTVQILRVDAAEAVIRVTAQP